MEDPYFDSEVTKPERISIFNENEAPTEAIQKKTSLTLKTSSMLTISKQTNRERDTQTHRFAPCYPLAIDKFLITNIPLKTNAGGERTCHGTIRQANPGRGRARLDRRDIQETRRIEKKGEKPRPIAVKFTTLSTKIKIFKQRKLLKNTDYYINEDFPQHILEKRKELLERMKIEREKGNCANIRYDKLIIRHNNADASGKKKRTLPTSLQDNDPTGTKQRIQVNKKNKTQTGQQRSSSLSEGVLKPGILSFLTNKNSGNLANEQLDRNIKQ
ncbi:hypothetical protein EVAR_100038_1 [Eumeta japonica]|uniref:Uncharacterized protein n=1 Tax=Eumeta variegata TaxID=151549 RepID=A0A4C1ZVL7_EUMVA|nr:hypothetical protein EVAR_100038_1 [Eumeta japonica]